jgi:CP family cyanate transporter-like MFS transporter
MTLTKSDSAETARDLNAFMQSWGYVISAIGPIALGAIWDATGKWSWALLALIFGTMIQMISGMTVGGRGEIHTER